ncbi:hypothetical protein [Rathayibacter sp. Leaf296]|uniref:hypothetical protein n=1 Tax=Rathayibacter sp. Leaf296 TaxID=1736327 RepID=UPI000702E862|nr:hypothetical protein [Rathayibacter sp. Leaf296]KQQ07412.1 hypothetical protein ASF46_17265 [Rathayibacter sp. Leaf296]
MSATARGATTEEDRLDQLRRGASTDDARRAAVELLIATGLVRDEHPWVLHDSGTWWIDFDRATEAVDALTVEHEKWGLTPSLLSVLEMAASLADGLTVHLRHVLPELDDEHTSLVMAAIAEAAGHPHAEPPQA